MNITIIGFQGTGKTTLGKILQKNNPSFSFYDTDIIIEKSYLMDLSNFIETYGISYFRYIEHLVLKNLLNLKKHKIISSGGGIIINEENRLLLKKKSLNILLEANESDILFRIQNDFRKRFRFQKKNSLQEEVKNLLKERHFYYNSINDYIYNTSFSNIESIAIDISKNIKKHIK